MPTAGRALRALALAAVMGLTLGACASDGAPDLAVAPGSGEDGGAISADLDESAPGDTVGSAGEGSTADDDAVAQVLGSLDGLELLAGGTFDPAQLGTRPTVVWFWAPWCPNCRAMAPGLAELADQYQGEMTILGVAGRGEVDEMHEFVSSTGTDGMAHVIDADGSVWAEFDVFSQPAFAFVTADGEVEVVIGRQTQDAMQRRFAQLLAS